MPDLIKSLKVPTCSGLAALAAAVLCTTPAIGAGSFSPPQGCTLEATVQNRGCTVSQHYSCASDAAGSQWTATFDEDGMSNLSLIDKETRWLQSLNPVSGLEDVLIEDSKDHASFSELLKTGRDEFDFWTESNTGEKLHHVGHDELTGEKVVVDGVNLETTRFSLTTYADNGDVLIKREGQQFINRAMGRFFGGRETFSDWTGDSGKTDDSPVDFSFPGQPGFSLTTPLYDCDMQMVGYMPGGGA